MVQSCAFSCMGPCTVKITAVPGLRYKTMNRNLLGHYYLTCFSYEVESQEFCLSIFMTNKKKTSKVAYRTITCYKLLEKHVLVSSCLGYTYDPKITEWFSIDFCAS